MEEFLRPNFFLMALLLSTLGAVGCRDSQPKTTTAVVPAASVAPPAVPLGAGSAVKSFSLNAGTPIEVAILEVFDSDTSSLTQFLPAQILDDVKGADGGVAIPAGSSALLVIQGVGKISDHSIAILGLNRVDVAGKAYKMDDGSKDLATLRFDENMSRGPGHKTVHIEKQGRITFKLGAAAVLR